MFAVEVGVALGVHGLPTTPWNGLPPAHRTAYPIPDMET
jgi:hypothetical protein